jgi:tRNA dimethylallyltransferase
MEDNRTVSNAHLIAVVGPTAAGKSALAMAWAQRLDAEIVNADAFCLYRGMDIGTAKPSHADRALVPHHVIDTHDVTDEVDVATYQGLARGAIADITGRGRTAILTGGSGLYVQAVLDDLRFPATHPATRTALEQQLAQMGAESLHRRLAQIDPAAAQRILPSNGRRVVRALEVNAITGAPFDAVLGAGTAWRDAVRIGWDPGVERVDAAIALRVQRMWERGFVAEVRAMAASMSRTAARAVGYRQILEALVAGDDPDTAIESTIRATRRLARKQRRWFRRDPRLQWVQSPAQVDQILGSLGV